MHCHFLVEGLGPATAHVVAACIGGDRKAVRHRQLEHRHHLCEVGTLATEQIFHAHRRLAVFVVKPKDVGHSAREVYKVFSCSACPRHARRTCTNAKSPATDVQTPSSVPLATYFSPGTAEVFVNGLATRGRRINRCGAVLPRLSMRSTSSWPG